MNTKYGYILLVAGFLGTAFTASLDATTMDWPWYSAAAAIGTIGVYIIKSVTRRDAQSDHVLEGDRVMLKQTLASIVANLEELNAGKAEIPTHEMRFEIDRLFRIDLNAFVEARESMKHLYSLQDFADVMSAFSVGERNINRVWSASADGYVDEVMAYLERAQVQFQEAQKVLEAVHKKHGEAVVAVT